MIAHKKIKAATFKHVESELFNYHQTLKLLNQRREELLHGSSSNGDENIGGGRSNLAGDPTGQKGIALVADKRLEHLQNICTAIENVLHVLPPEKMNFVKIRYWTHPQTLTWEGIALQLNYGRSTLFNWREEIVTAIANRLGWH